MKKKVAVVVFGSEGRMGREIRSLLAGHRHAEFWAGIDRDGTMPDVRARLGYKVAIDFSSPALLPHAVRWCVKNRIPYVCGTTGLSPRLHRILQTAARRIPILWAPNMSLGVHAAVAMLESVTQPLREFDWQIEEIHHSRKKDRPSGTAKFIADRVSRGLQRKLPATAVIRGGGIFGIHKVWIMGEEETITVEHTALNRKVFARGAVTAALWMVTRRRGLYEMSDMWK